MNTELHVTDTGCKETIRPSFTIKELCTQKFLRNNPDLVPMHRAFRTFLRLFGLKAHHFYKVSVIFVENIRAFDAFTSIEEVKGLFTGQTLVIHLKICSGGKFDELVARTFAHELLHAFDWLVGGKLLRRLDSNQIYFATQEDVHIRNSSEHPYPLLSKRLDNLFDFIKSMSESDIEEIIREQDCETFAYIGDTLFAANSDRRKKLSVREPTIPLQRSCRLRPSYMRLINCMKDILEDCDLPGSI